MIVEELRRALADLPGDQVVKIVNESDASGVNAHDVRDVRTFRFAPSDSPGWEYIPDSDAGANDYAEISGVPGAVPFEELQSGVVLFFDSRAD